MSTSTDKLIWKNKHFPDPVESKEDIILVLRQDLVIIVFQILPYLLIFLVFTLLRAVIYRFIAGFNLVPQILDIFYYSFNIVLLLNFFMKFHNYLLSVQIITNRRIIDVTQKGLFSRETNELGFDNIEDGTVKQMGLIPTIFNFGDVIIQTAAGSNKDISGFIFKNIPDPVVAHKIIMEICHDRSENKPTPAPKPQNNPVNFDPNINYKNPLPISYRQQVIESTDEEPVDRRP
jgi:hypothetical protein